MKRKWLGLALAAAMAFAGAATAAVYTDSSANYAEGWENGSNGGEGFMPWKIASNSGSGWAGGGIWETGKAEVSGDVVDANGNAFGIVGKGDGSSFTATRNFRASLGVGDSFEFDMAVNWDCGYNPDSKKGIALLLDGEDAIVINNDPYPGPISVNGFTDDPALQNYGTGTMHWTIVAKDATTVTVTGTARDGETEPYSADITLASSALTGFRLQSALQQDWEDGETEEERNAKADKRQSYFNNFKLTIARELPPIQNLTLAEKESIWAITSAGEKQLTFVVGRDTTAGEAVVTIASSSDFVTFSSATVTLADGEASAEVSATAQLTGSGNYAAITVEAAGYTSPDAWEVKGPQYRLSVEKYEASPDETVNFWMDWDDNGIRDDAKVTIEADPADAFELPTEWTWNDRAGGAYVESSFTAISSGTLILKYDGVQFADYGVTVLEAGATLSGPTSIRVGVDATYTLDVTLPTGMTDSVGLGASGTSKVVIAPEVAQEIDASTSLKFTVTALNAGTVTLTPFDTEGLSFNELVVTVTEAPDPSAYLAYDDASLYTEGFDTTSHGIGERGFDAWSVYEDAAESGGVFVGEDVPEALSGILEAGKVLGLYANGSWENNNYKMYRGFGGDIEAGQEFSIDFACQATGGSRFVQLVRMWDGTGYPRFEVYTADGFVGVNLEGFEGGDIGWASADRVVHVSVLRSADGSTYTLSLTSGSDSWSKDIPASTENWGDGLQGFIIGAWNSGSDLYFNRMSIEQVEEPVVERAIGWAAGVWNPDAAGEYKFAISATTDDIGVVALSVKPSDGALSLSTDTVDLTGKTLAPFTVTLSEANEGDHFVITATPVDTTVAPIEYNVTVVSSHVTLSSDAWEYPVSAGEIWLGLSASVSKYGTYAITSSDEAVLAVPEASEAIAVGSPDPSWFNVTIVGPGQATIYATAEGEETPAAEYTFTVIADAPVIDGATIEVSFADGDGLSGKVDDALRDQFTDVKAQVLQWNGVDAFDEVEVLENEAEWPDMQFTPSIDNPVIRLIFVK